MSKEEGNTKAKSPVNPENSLIQAAVKQSIILPRDILAKAKNLENPAPNISTLQAAIKQCASLPQNRKVVCESLDKSSKKD